MSSDNKDKKSMLGDIVQMKFNQRAMSSNIVQRKLRARVSQMTETHEIRVIKIEKY